MDLQMYWLLVKKEYIIVFVVVCAVVYHTVCVTSAKWFAEKSPESWAVVS